MHVYDLVMRLVGRVMPRLDSDVGVKLGLLKYTEFIFLI